MTTWTPPSRRLVTGLLLLAGAFAPTRRAAAQGVAPATALVAPSVLGDAVDVALDFQAADQTYFVASRVTRRRSSPAPSTTATRRSRSRSSS